MFDDQRGPPTTRRGWLSDIFFPTLLEDTTTAHESLTLRLGGKATVDDPIFGRASGMPALERFVVDMSTWLKKHSAQYERSFFTMGVDRDVTEGALTLTLESKTVELPVAVIAERRKSREVELRLYYSPKPIKGTNALRSPVVPRDDNLPLPAPIADHLDALKRGDLDAVMQTFETGATLRESRGLQHSGASLREYYLKLMGSARDGSFELLKGGAADDGRTCALEYTFVKLRGRNVTPQAGLVVFERGDSGLLRALRIYENVEVEPTK